MKNHHAKLNYLARKQKLLCPIAKAHNGHALPGELHHRLHNSKVNRRLYPLFLNSIWNLWAVNHNYHMMYGSSGKISVLEATKREAFLKRHPMIARAINMEDKR
jgi:hypothetical protein